jgi:GntR family transcriptional repressor for pyruvate dehydrogenase complex
LAATRIAPAEVRSFKKMFDGFSAKPSLADVRRYLQCDRQFHWRLVELTENPHLAAAMESVNMMISAYQVGVPRSLAESLPEHRAILGALARRDPDASEVAMRVHIRRSVERLWQRARSEAGESASP